MIEKNQRGDHPVDRTTYAAWMWSLSFIFPFLLNFHVSVICAFVYVKFSVSIFQFLLCFMSLEKYCIFWIMIINYTFFSLLWSKMYWIHQKIASGSGWLLLFFRHVDTTLTEVLQKESLIGSWYIFKNMFLAKVHCHLILSSTFRSAMLLPFCLVHCYVPGPSLQC